LRDITKPAPGFFRMRFVRGGPDVAARIYRPCPMDLETGEALARFYPLVGEVDGAPASVLWIWERGFASNAAEFAYLTARADWARRVAPDHPFANPRRPITWDTIPTLF
jgi:hypothetical protein